MSLLLQEFFLVRFIWSLYNNKFGFGMAANLLLLLALCSIATSKPANVLFVIDESTDAKVRDKALFCAQCNVDIGILRSRS